MITEAREGELRQWARKQFWVMTRDEVAKCFHAGLDDVVSLHDDSFYATCELREGALRFIEKHPDTWRQRIESTIYGMVAGDIDHLLAAPTTQEERFFVTEEQVVMYMEELGKLRPVGRTGECGCIVYFQDFRRVQCHKVPYDLTDADQARVMLQFMCDRDAIGPEKALTKAEILEHLKSEGVTAASDWRPAHVFRKPLKRLYDDAIGCNKRKGLYWINPH